jgi:hypothetical protein
MYVTVTAKENQGSETMLLEVGSVSFANGSESGAKFLACGLLGAAIVAASLY